MRLDNSVPAAPSGLVIEASSSTSIYLSWLDNSDDETGYRVDRSADGGNQYDTLAVLAANTTEFEDIGLQPDTGYQYRVYAFNGAGSGPASTA